MIHKQHTEYLHKIQASLGNDFDNIPFQIDLVNTQVTSKQEIVKLLNDNSSRLQHLLDYDPRLIRWWFNDFSIALKMMLKLSEEDLSHRLICVEKNTLFLQVGDEFN